MENSCCWTSCLNERSASKTLFGPKYLLIINCLLVLLFVIDFLLIKDFLHIGDEFNSENFIAKVFLLAGECNGDRTGNIIDSYGDAIFPTSATDGLISSSYFVAISSIPYFRLWLFSLFYFIYSI